MARTGTRNFASNDGEEQHAHLPSPSTSCHFRRAPPTHPSAPPCTAHREIKPLADALGLPAEGIHTRKTAVDSEYALAITLNFLAFPKREHSDMAAMWRIDRRVLSE